LNIHDNADKGADSECAARRSVLVFGVAVTAAGA
jgi:hypothetical protein